MMKNIKSEANHIVSDIERMSRVEATQIYGIEFLDEGKVYDPVYNRTFVSVLEWAEFSVEQDEVEYSEHFGGRHEYDDMF